MNPTTTSRSGIATAQRPQLGLSLIELMIAIALGMIVMAALLALFVNVTRTNNEMAQMNRQIENGRFAIQVLQDDVVHAGFWGSYVPQFDDLTAATVPLDAPNALPDPCLVYNTTNWTTDYLSNLIGIPVQGWAGTCAAVANQQANTDVLVVRHAQTCVAGVGGCENDVAGKLYFQSTLCEDEISATAQEPNTSTTIKLAADASDEDDFYNGTTIRIVAGLGAGQSRTITGYDGSTKVATLDPGGPAWVTVPNNSSIYSFGLGYVLGTSGHIFHERGCSTLAGKRKFVSNIYYIRDHASTAGDGIPTLMRSSFDLSGGTLAHHAGPPLTQPLIEGIQGFRVEYGIDAQSDSGGTVNYAAPVIWADPLNKVSPINRGDGVPEGGYVNAAGLTCTSITDCNAANVVAVRIHVLARSLQATPGYTDTKTYQLGDQTMGPFNDNFKRHVFSTTVRLVNPAGRRDTP
jgi:type II secretory pathway pseudopilin PulG